ncbi:MAG TPA: type II toxin-antitoxin system RelE/ParE family toxin [Rhizomicrobium sp.]|nr:type II toxin-antitoxin system RelE/ParE family toxin [Rhizomicrobium sp.]
MSVIFTPGARAQLRAIHDYVARDDKIAAGAVIARVEYVAGLLGENPGMGRKLQRSRLHRFPVRPYPYLIFYEVAGLTVRIIRVQHAARRPTLHEPASVFAR